AASPELNDQDVAVEREQVDENAVDAVAQAAGRAALLVVFEGLELRAQSGRNRAARLNPERAEGALALFGVALLGDRLGVIRRELLARRGTEPRFRQRADAEGTLHGALAAVPCIGVGCEPMGHADVRLGLARGPGCELEAHAIPPVDALGDVA